MNAEQLRDDLGFQLEGRAPGGESGGAWFAIAADGERVVLKWFADEGVADRYAVLLPALDVLRSRGVPVPKYRFVRAVDGWTLSAQQVLPGRSFAVWPPQLVDRMIECVSAAAGIVGPRPAPALQGWGESVIHTLTVGEDGWAQHDSLRAHSDRARRILDFVESIGADAEPSWFPTSGLVHYDLVAFAFDLDGHGQQIWDRVEALVEPHVLRAYVAHMALRRTDWAIRYRPEDVPRQLDRAERMLDL